MDVLNSFFQDGDYVSPKILVQKGIIGAGKRVKILGDGELDKKLNFSGVVFSKQARDKILKAGGTTNEKIENRK